MAARIVRRLYIYLAAFIGLQMLSIGSAGLVMFLGERLLGGAVIGPADIATLRLSSSIALIVVGLPLWAGHWALAQHDARDPEGQYAALRRLYAYAVLLVAALTTLFALSDGLASVLEDLAQGQMAISPLGSLVTAGVGGSVWLAHWRHFGRDRDLVERYPPNATLRRWYLVLTLWLSLAMASFGAGALIHGLLQRFVFAGPGLVRQLAMPAAALISGMLIWLPHELWSRRLVRSAGPLQTDELDSTLRQVYLALVITGSLVAALTGLAALLAAGIRAALGAAPWVEALGDETRAAAALVVALPLLFYHWEQLMLTARLSGASERTDTARRLVIYVMGAVSLVALYFGLGGLNGTLMRLWLAGGGIGDAWRTPFSWYAATAIVALPVYGLASWRSEQLVRGAPDEERVLARRIYLYLGLLFGVVATVITTTQLIQEVVVAILGQATASAAGEIGRLAGYTVLGGAITTAYGLMLRRASAARSTIGTGRTIMLVAEEPLREALFAAVAQELPGATVVAFDEWDSPERRAALADADVLVMALAALGDRSLAAFEGPRLLLATPLEGVTLVGARLAGPSLAREAAREVRALCAVRPPAPQSAMNTLSPGSA